MDLTFWANVAEVFGAITIVIGLIFGGVQLREYRRQRQEAVASDLMRSFYDANLAESVALIQSMSDGLSLAEIRALGIEHLRAALKIATTFETMGLMVFRRIAPFDLALELVGGLVQVMWRKLERYTREIRVEQSDPAFAEWFEWLAMVCRQHKSETAPAYERGENWRP